MADSILYLRSLQSLSSALEIAMKLTRIRKQRIEEFERAPSSLNNDLKNQWFYFIDSIPRFSKIQEEEDTLAKEYVELVGQSLDYALKFVQTLDCEDSQGKSISGLQEHLQLLSEIICSHYSSPEEAIIIDKESFLRTFSKLTAFPKSSQIERITQTLERINGMIKMS